MNAEDEVSQGLGWSLSEKPTAPVEKSTGKRRQEMALLTGMEMRLNDCDPRDNTTRGASVSGCPFFSRG